VPRYKIWHASKPAAQLSRNAEYNGDFYQDLQVGERIVLLARIS